jgi:FixJ family two-component response regulator
MPELQESDAIIAIVDDGPSVRRGLERLVRSVGWKTETFASAQDWAVSVRAKVG